MDCEETFMGGFKTDQYSYEKVLNDGENIGLSVLEHKRKERGDVQTVLVKIFLFPGHGAFPYQGVYFMVIIASIH
ncbi:MAG: hypothetical protein PHE26_10490 [Syntrophomonadaceae bacterium]|nr:hypothetical protein [Syntrophomonadaceae bacterium]